MNEPVDRADARPVELRDVRELRRQVDEVVSATPVLDMHTHLFPPQFGSLNLYFQAAIRSKCLLRPACLRSPRIDAFS